MQLTPTTLALALFVAGTLAAPAPYGDEELNLVARGKGKLAERVNKLPAELRLQIGSDVKSAQKADRDRAETSANKSKYGKSIKPLKKGNPVPNNWQQQPAHDVYAQNRPRGYDDMLEEREFNDLVEELVARGKGKLAERVNKLPAELRLQIGSDVKAAQKADRDRAETSANKSKYNKAIKPLKKGNPVPNNWQQQPAHDVYAQNRPRGYYDDFLEERDYLVEELVARGKGKLAERVNKLPAELRLQIGSDVKAAQKADRERAETAANKSKYNKAIKPLKKGNPVPNNWEQQPALDVYHQNRPRGFYDDILEEREFFESFDELD